MAIDGLTIKTIDTTAYRAIVSLRDSINIVADITSGSDAEADVLNTLEMIFKPAEYQSNSPIIHRPFEESDHFNAIEYPFRHHAESRYSDGSYGVWYGSDTIETAIAETVFHWLKFLFDTHDSIASCDGMMIERKVYSVALSGSLLDVNATASDHPSLMSNSYEQCQQLGSEARNGGIKGILAPSARNKGGVCFAVFDPSLLSKPTNACYLTYKIEGEFVNVYRNTQAKYMKLNINELLAGFGTGSSGLRVVK